MSVSHVLTGLVTVTIGDWILHNATTLPRASQGMAAAVYNNSVYLLYVNVDLFTYTVFDENEPQWIHKYHKVVEMRTNINWYCTICWPTISLIMDRIIYPRTWGTLLVNMAQSLTPQCSHVTLNHRKPCCILSGQMAHSFMFMISSRYPFTKKKCPFQTTTRV